MTSSVSAIKVKLGVRNPCYWIISMSYKTVLYGYPNECSVVLTQFAPCQIISTCFRMHLDKSRKFLARKHIWVLLVYSMKFDLNAPLSFFIIIYAYHVANFRLLLLLGRSQSTPLPPPPPPRTTLILQPTLSSIAAGKQSLGTLVSASSRSTNVRACPPMLLLPDSSGNDR